jgi:catalase
MSDLDQEKALSAKGALPRLTAIGAIVGGIAILFGCAAGWLTPSALTPARVADRFEELDGIHPGFRRNHAKGVCVSGYFASNGQGTEVCKSQIFRPGRTPVLGRFSLGGGMPNVPDDAHTVRGLGLRLQSADGQEWRTAMINFPVFPVRTPQAFYELLAATHPDPATGKPDPAKIQALVAGHPETGKAFAVIGAGPVSAGFANSAFNSLNAFKFVNEAGAAAWVRWSFMPSEAFKPLEAAAPPADKNYLFDALIAEIHQHPLQWHLIITVGQPGDPTDDATMPWPAGRRQIDAGTLTIDHVESDDTSLARDINFDPLTLPDGMAASDDPLLEARSAVYSRSFTRREGEQKTPSAISPEEAGK